jgi:hypothetical protein
MTPDPSNARAVAERGIAIYSRKYRDDFERKWRGRFAAIDIESERAYVADFPEQAISEAKQASPNGVFYLIRIGSVGAFKTARVVLNADTRPI